MANILKVTEAVDAIAFRAFANKKIVVTNRDEDMFKLQCPRLYMPFGVSCFEPEYGGPAKYTVDFTLNGHDEEGSFVNRFITEFRALEDKICHEVVAQSEAIFNGQTKTFSEVKSMFTSAIRDDNAGWPPKLKAKVDVTSDGRAFKSHFYDEDGNPRTDEPARGIYARASGRSILELSSIWFFNGKIGALWKVNQLTVYEAEDKSLPAFAFKNV